MEHHPRVKQAEYDDLGAVFPNAALRPPTGDVLDLDHAVYVIRQQAA